MDTRDMVQVYTTFDVIEASVVTGILEGAGLEPVVRDLTVTPYPVSVGPLSEKRIAVPCSQAEEARSLLERAVEDGVLGGGPPLGAPPSDPEP